MAEKIVMIIKPDGSVMIEGVGFSGPACDKVLRELAESLGAVTDVTKKPEYHAAAHAIRRAEPTGR